MSTKSAEKKVAKKTAKNYTLEEAKNKLIKEQEEKVQDEQRRLQEFVDLVLAAEEKTGCTLQVDLTSTLNNLRIIPVLKPE